MLLRRRSCARTARSPAFCPKRSAERCLIRSKSTGARSMPMTREQLAHVLRAVSQIAEDPDVLVIGSQSILGSYSEDELPPEATGSMEVDTTFLSDPEDAKSGRVDAMIGELSSFHN